MGEPSLFCGFSTNAQVYRLARLEWAGVPLVLRVDLSTTGGTMQIVKLEAPSWNFPPGRVLEQRTVPLGQDDRREFEDVLARANVWRQPSIARDHDAGVGEGTTWIFETLVEGRYHVVSRWLPHNDSPLLALGRTFLKLGQVTEAELKGDAPGVIMRPPRPQRGDPPPPPGDMSHRDK